MIVGKTIENHFGQILNYLCNRATNVSILNFNRKIKSFMERLRGVDDKDFSFSDLLLYLLNFSTRFKDVPYPKHSLA